MPLPEILTAEQLALAKRVIKEARMMVGLDGLQPMDLHSDSFVCREAFAKVLRVVVAEVREEKRKEVVAEIGKLSEANLTPLYRELYAMPSLQSPSPEPSERAMRVAEKFNAKLNRCPGGAIGLYSSLQIDLALLIDAEFGAGK